MNSFSSPFHSSVFRFVLHRAGSSWRAEGNLNWHTSSFLASHPRRKKELQLFIFQIKSLAKPASTKQPFHPFSHQSDRFQRVTVKCGRSFMQLCICNQALCEREDRIVLFFEEYDGIESLAALGAHGVVLTQVFFQRRWKRGCAIS